LKNAKERMDVIAAYRDVGTYRGAAAICGTTHKTVRRIIEAREAASNASAGGALPARAPRARNYDELGELVVEKVAKTFGKISATPRRLLSAWTTRRSMKLRKS
jgi:hypothetical protein